MKKLLVAIAFATAMVGVAQAEDAKSIYDAQCAKCHGADGKGGTKMGQKLGIKDYTATEIKDDAKAAKAIKDGLKEGDKTLMKPAEGLSDDQIKGLVTYMKSFKK